MFLKHFKGEKERWRWFEWAIEKAKKILKADPAKRSFSTLQENKMHKKLKNFLFCSHNGYIYVKKERDWSSTWLAITATFFEDWAKDRQVECCWYTFVADSSTCNIIWCHTKIRNISCQIFFEFWLFLLHLFPFYVNFYLAAGFLKSISITIIFTSCLLTTITQQ